MRKKDQTGRTLLEMIAALVIIALITLAVYKIFQIAVRRATTRTLAQEITTRIVQLRHQNLTVKGIQTETPEQALARAKSSSSGSGIPIQTVDTSFVLRVGSEEAPLELSLCQRVLKHFQQSELCFIEGSCHEEYGDFAFHRVCSNGNSSENGSSGNNSSGGSGSSGGNSGGGSTNSVSGGANGSGGVTPAVTCDSHATKVDSECKCDAGYYGDGKTCTACPAGTFSITVGAEFSTTCQSCVDRRWSSAGATACNTCSPGQTHNSNHTGCTPCPKSIILGACGCSNKVPDGDGGCEEKSECTQYFVLDSNNVCQPEGCTEHVYNGQTFCSGPYYAYYSQASDWCSARGMEIASFADLGIQADNCTCEGVDWTSLRNALGEADYTVLSSTQGKCYLSTEDSSTGAESTCSGGSCWGPLGFTALCKKE